MNSSRTGTRIVEREGSVLRTGNNGVVCSTRLAKIVVYTVEHESAICVGRHGASRIGTIVRQCYRHARHAAVVRHNDSTAYLTVSRPYSGSEYTMLGVSVITVIYSTDGIRIYVSG